LAGLRDEFLGRFGFVAFEDVAFEDFGGERVLDFLGPDANIGRVAAQFSFQHIEDGRAQNQGVQGEPAQGLALSMVIGEGFFLPAFFREEPKQAEVVFVFGVEFEEVELRQEFVIDRLRW